ncbi:MAG TPA: phosphoribosylamine--glycine ligase [Pyrinomonadaceae bacterium]|nr:phosphoribosylamine--glycine ligase [Pyrinomonadaceae bacterium]
MKALVIGSGGREHAILWALKRTSAVPLNLYCAPGNGGISELARCIPVSVDDHASLLDFAASNRIDLTVVGPEGPLADGIVDEFERAGLRIMGPNRAAARLESSKAFAKEFMRRHQIPTADFCLAHSQAEAYDALRSGKFSRADGPVVIKADGLAAGKGVVVAGSRLEAEKAVLELLSGKLVSSAAAEQLLIEETLTGREVSVLVFSDGRDYVVMPPARDHKRIGEQDTGPNTGGMGAITDPSVVDDETLKRIQREVIEPTLVGATVDGFPFKGILFVGLMLTSDGPKVLEYNVRFGDPETQAILMRLESDLCEIFMAITNEELGKLNVKWSGLSSACVVLASAGYPGPYETGQRISGLKAKERNEELQVFHAGTALLENGDLVTSGGRVLGVTATDVSLEKALERCYAEVNTISWSGIHYRRDIGQFRGASTGA